MLYVHNHFWFWYTVAANAGVDSVGRIESFFDAISYQKGGSVIRMLRAFLNNQRLSDEQYGLRRSLLQVCLCHLCYKLHASTSRSLFERFSLMCLQVSVQGACFSSVAQSTAGIWVYGVVQSDAQVPFASGHGTVCISKLAQACSAKQKCAFVTVPVSRHIPSVSTRGRLERFWVCDETDGL